MTRMAPATGPGRLCRGRRQRGYHDDSESCNGSYIKTIGLLQIWLAGLAANLARCVLGWRISMQNPRLRKASRIGRLRKALDSSHARNALFAVFVLNALTVQFTTNLVDGGGADTRRESDVARYINSRLHLSWYQLKDWLSFFRLALCFETIDFIIWVASGFFEISLLIGKGTLNIFPLLTAAYFMLTLVRIGTALRLAWPRFVFVMQLLARLFTF
jgi:hypothetical protein